MKTTRLGPAPGDYPGAQGRPNPIAAPRIGAERLKVVAAGLGA